MSQFSRSLELSKSSDEWVEAVGIGCRELPLAVAEDLPQESLQNCFLGCSQSHFRTDKRFPMFSSIRRFRLAPSAIFDDALIN